MPRHGEQGRRAARAEGAQAAANGVQRYACPYPVTAPERMAWLAGWDEVAATISQGHAECERRVREKLEQIAAETDL